MAIILEYRDCSDLRKYGRTLGIRPFLVAERRPGVKILGEAPLHGLPVDMTPITLPCATWISPCSSVMVPRKAQLCFESGASANRVWPNLMSSGSWGIRVIRPSFQQQHGRSLRSCQSAGQHRSRRSPTDDNNVIFHGPSFNALSSQLGWLRLYRCP